MKQLVRRAIRRLGLDVVRLRNSNETLATHLSNVLRQGRIDCVIDVGANAGQYGQFLRELGYTGHIVSFEPVAEVFRRLEAASRGDAKWSCHRMALGDRAEEKVLNVYESTVFSSFLQANDYSRGIWKSLNSVVPESVRVARLDEIYDETIGVLGAKRCLLKLDTQGYDKFAFAGARGVIQSVAALQTELSLIAIYEGMPAPYELLNTFHSCGYYISGMYPINRDKSLAVIEYDCVLVRRDAEVGTQ